MFMTLDEYWLHAKRIMLSYGGKDLVNNDDNVAYVVNYIIRADETFDGQSSKGTWRINRAKYAIRHLKTKYNKQKKYHNTVSLNQLIDNRQLQDVIPDPKSCKNTQHEDIIETAQSVLNDRQRECFDKYYVDGYTMEEIGEQFNLSRQRIDQILKDSIKKVKTCVLN